MHDHGEILALAAAAIDFELDPVERAQLQAGLEGCPLCRRQAAAMRATATILSRPSDIGTPSRVRDVVIGAAIRSGRRTPQLRTILAAGLSILAVLGGTVFISGNRGFGIIETASPSAPAPTAAAPTSPNASPSPSDGLPSTPTETIAPTPSATEPPPPADDGPLRAGEIAAMVSDGRLVIRTQAGTGADSAIFKTKIYPGQRVLTLEGPVEASGYPWFRVQLGSIEGWVAAAGLDGEPWLAPVRDGVIAFVHDASDGYSEAIHTIRADGNTGEAALFSDPRFSHYEQLAWSPDGRRLAFVSVFADPIDAQSEIFVIDADGSNLIQLTQNDVVDDSPAWSSDGTQIAFRQAYPDPAAGVVSNVMLVRADGSATEVLGPGANPVWSPDGLQLAMTVSDGGSSHVWVQGVDGSDRRQVTNVSVASSRPAWSPDGQRLVISSSGLFLADVATGSITRLTVEPGSMPTWSVRGTIAFATTGSASPSVFLIDPDGSNLSLAAGVAASPEWSPDGRRFLLISGGESGSSIGVGEPGVVDPLTPGGIRISDVADGRSPAWQPRLP